MYFINSAVSVVFVSEAAGSVLSLTLLLRDAEMQGNMVQQRHPTGELILGSVVLMAVDMELGS